MKEKWILQTKRADFNALAARFGIDPVTVRLIVNRGYDTEEKIDRYLHAGIGDMYPPALLKDMDTGAGLVLDAVRAGNGIVIASDYDADGICSGHILKEGLRSLGARAWVKTPDRSTEGYGLNERIVREASAEGASMLLTCDNGIAALAPIDLAKKLGLTVVVTDHHEVPYTFNNDGSKKYVLPLADAVIDPARPDCPYPFKKICGATVAWKLIQQLFLMEELEKDSLSKTRTAVCVDGTENEAAAATGDDAEMAGCAAAASGDDAEMAGCAAAASGDDAEMTDCPAAATGDAAEMADCAAAATGDASAFGLNPANTRRIRLLESLLELAAFATITDVCDLTDENRIIVKEGLARMRRTSRPGLRALASVNSVSLDNLTPYHIGFVFGPCINAAGRLSGVKDAFTLLEAESLDEAWPVAARLKELNDSRKYLTQQGTEQAAQQLNDIEKRTGCLPKVVVLYLKGCHESLAGIIAGRIRESCNRPTIVLTDTDKSAGTPSMLKGSGRSIEAYNMFDALQRCRGLLDHFGGHPMAAGMTLPAANLDDFRTRLNDECALSEEDFIPTIDIDVPMPIGYISEKLIEEFRLLEPTGKGNPQPLFAENYFRIRSIRPIGKERRFFRLSVMNRSGSVIDALYFNDGEQFAADLREYFGEKAWNDALLGHPNPIELMLAYYPGVNEYQGMKNLQIIISHYSFIRNKNT